MAYAFDDPPAGDHDERTRLLGGKGAGLVAMTEAGLPVPPGFTLTTDACRRYLADGWDDELATEVRDGLADLESRTGRALGDRTAPLLVSVRSGAPTSMPGMMDTVLDVGMNGVVEAALASATGDTAFARDTHARFRRSFAEVVSGAPDEVGVTIPDDPHEQVIAAVRAVFESWTAPPARRYREVEGIDGSLGTAATVQAMVFGNLDDDSGTGVAFSRDPSTGAPGLMGDFLRRAQGEDVVAGRTRTLPLADMAVAWPALYTELERIAGVLEHTLGDMVDLEFTVESGRLWMLQARRAKRSPIAHFRCAIDMAEDDAFPLDRAGAVERCRHLLVDPPTVADETPGESGPSAGSVQIAAGLPASPGVAVGVLCLDPDEAVERHAAGESVILARRDTSPSDVHGMAASAGIFTLLGGLVSHAAVVARDWGLPAVVGATGAELRDDGLVGPGGFVPVGATVTVDGTEGTLVLGGIASFRRVAPEVDVIRSWARELGVHDDSPDASPTAPDDPAVFPILHVLRIRGLAAAEAIAATTGLEPGAVTECLRSLAADGRVLHVEARDLWRLTDDGRLGHADALERSVAAVDLAAVPYDRFLALNATFKEICTAWQVRHDEPNDHTDAGYDAHVIERLATLDRDVAPILGDIADALPWTARYRHRLADALARVRAGDPKAFTGVLADSYHDVWMELHEDLILTQGIDRAAEGST